MSDDGAGAEADAWRIALPPAVREAVTTLLARTEKLESQVEGLGARLGAVETENAALKAALGDEARLASVRYQTTATRGELDKEVGEAEARLLRRMDADRESVYTWVDTRVEEQLGKFFDSQVQQALGERADAILHQQGRIEGHLKRELTEQHIRLSELERRGAELREQEAQRETAYAERELQYTQSLMARMRSMVSEARTGLLSKVSETNTQLSEVTEELRGRLAQIVGDQRKQFNQSLADVGGIGSRLSSLEAGLVESKEALTERVGAVETSVTQLKSEDLGALTALTAQEKLVEDRLLVLEGRVKRESESMQRQIKAVAAQIARQDAQTIQDNKLKVAALAEDVARLRESTERGETSASSLGVRVDRVLELTKSKMGELRDLVQRVERSFVADLREHRQQVDREQIVAETREMVQALQAEQTRIYKQHRAANGRVAEMLVEILDQMDAKVSRRDLARTLTAKADREELSVVMSTLPLSSPRETNRCLSCHAPLASPAVDGPPDSAGPPRERPQSAPLKTPQTPRLPRPKSAAAGAAPRRIALAPHIRPTAADREWARRQVRGRTVPAN